MHAHMRIMHADHARVHAYIFCMHIMRALYAYNHTMYTERNEAMMHQSEGEHLLSTPSERLLYTVLAQTNIECNAACLASSDVIMR